MASNIISIIALAHMRNIFLYIYLKNKNRRRWWVRHVNKKRLQQGIYNNLFRELYITDEEQFFEYTRMDITQFNYLFSLLQPSLQKQNFIREPLPPRLRLIVTLRLVYDHCHYCFLIFFSYFYMVIFLF